MNTQAEGRDPDAHEVIVAACAKDIVFGGNGAAAHGRQVAEVRWHLVDRSARLYVPDSDVMVIRH